MTKCSWWRPARDASSVPPPLQFCSSVCSGDIGEGQRNVYSTPLLHTHQSLLTVHVCTLFKLLLPWLSFFSLQVDFNSDLNCSKKCSFQRLTYIMAYNIYVFHWLLHDRFMHFRVDQYEDQAREIIYGGLEFNGCNIRRVRRNF